MKKSIFVLLTFMLCLTGYGQDFIGHRQSNYAGIDAGSLNPAFIADSRLLVDVSLFGFSGTGYTDYLYFNPYSMPYGYYKTITDVDNDQASANYMESPFNWRIIRSDSAEIYKSDSLGNIFEHANPQGFSRNMFYNHEINVFNFMVCLDEEISFSMGFKQRTFFNADRISNEVIRLAQTDLELPSLWLKDFNSQAIKMSYSSWNEFSFGLASVIYDEKEHFIKSGFNVKVLQGLGSAFVNTDNFEYELLNADTSLSMKGDFYYGHSQNLAVANFGSNFSPATLGLDFNNPFNGAGWGMSFDLGAVYEWRPDWEAFKYDMDGETNLWKADENKYRFRGAFAINDIGGINYNRGELSRSFTLNATNPLDLGFIDDSDDLITFNDNVDTLVKNGQASYIDDKGRFFMNTPTHVAVNLDYSIYRNVYLNGSAFLAFGMKNNHNGVHYNSSLSITPRFDSKYFGLAVPISHNAIYGTRIGMSVRAFPIVIGTSNLAPLFSSEKDVDISGADIYFAIKVPIHRRVPKDFDEDKVSDKIDLCVETPGVWQFKGCPDSDNDGVQDSEDRCPTEPGLIEFSGCPDRDGDKIIDLRDDCPDTPGLIEFNGCPDTDDDKIIDKNDDCPEIPGLPEFNGCPDTDGDGLKDEDDLCPDTPGPLENSGCPDTDQDGIFDYLDECPSEAGPKENKGCPWPDTDGDGILDKDDKCPNNIGPAENNGCPYIDTDGDGILDKDDDCVNVPGVPENNGCPVIKEEEQEILKTAFEALEFETAKAIIKDVSFESLDDLAELLIKKPEWRLSVAGHTDSQGGAQNNLILSKKRAEAVKLYLNQRGVDENRIIVEYYGEEKPIADNDTPEGRQKNRRVEMTIIFE